MVTAQLLSNSWFGKAVAGTLALASADVLVPEGFVWTAAYTAVAIGLGHQWDVYAQHRFSPTQAQASPQMLRNDATQGNPWLVFAFCGMGRLASTDGAVLPEHIQLAEEVMARMRLDARGRHRAIGWFNAGKQPGCPLSDVAQRCVAASDPTEEALVLECLGRCAAVRDSALTRQALGDLGSLLQFRRADAGARPRAEGEHARLEDAAALLAVELDGSSDAIKLAYRRGVARYHPDRLPADATHREREHAEQRMTAYREAYERLLADAEARRLAQPRTVRNSKTSVDRNA